MTVQLLLPVWTWNWLVSVKWSGTLSLSQSTSGGSSSSPPVPLRVQCMTTGFPNEEMTVLGFCSNTRSLVGGEKRLGLIILSTLKKKKPGKVLLFWSLVLNGAPYLVPLTNREADLSGTVLIVGQRLLVRRWQLLLHHQCQTQPPEISMFLKSNVKAHICRGQACLAGSKRIILSK